MVAIKQHCALAFKRVRILFRWTDRVPYAESRYLAALQKRPNNPAETLAVQPQGVSWAALFAASAEAVPITARGFDRGQLAVGSCTGWMHT